MIKKILTAIDGSKLADKALDFALDLAEKYAAEVQITTVLEEPAISLVAQGMFYAPTSTEKYLKEVNEFYKKVLSEALNKAKKFKPKLNVTTKLLRGRAADKIVETAKQDDFDLVVIGGRGLGGIKEFFLGSVSDRVADEAPCPVLIVKD